MKTHFLLMQSKTFITTYAYLQYLYRKYKHCYIRIKKINMYDVFVNTMYKNFDTQLY